MEGQRKTKLVIKVRGSWTQTSLRNTLYLVTIVPLNITNSSPVPLNPGIFGVPLSESILYANVAISLTNEQGESFIYGYVPIVVAKCGVFLKEKGT